MFLFNYFWGRFFSWPMPKNGSRPGHRSLRLRNNRNLLQSVCSLLEGATNLLPHHCMRNVAEWDKGLAVLSSGGGAGCGWLRPSTSAIPDPCPALRAGVASFPSSFYGFS